MKRGSGPCLLLDDLDPADYCRAAGLGRKLDRQLRAGGDLHETLDDQAVRTPGLFGNVEVRQERPALDGHVEHMADEARFKALVKSAPE